MSSRDYVPNIESLIEQLKPNCETISKNAVGLFIKPKKDLAPALLIAMGKKLEKLGATYSPTTNTFLLSQIPKKEQRDPERLADLLLTDLVPGPNPRLNIDTVGLQELYADMLKNGQKQRLEVRPSPLFPGKYEIIDGNRRKRVAEMLGWPIIKAVIRDMTDQEAYENAFIINTDRQELSAFEKGRWFKILMEKWPEEYPTQLSLAKRFGYHTHAPISSAINYYEEEQARLDTLKPKPKEEIKATENTAQTPINESAEAEQKTEQQKQTTAAQALEQPENVSRETITLNEPQPVTPTPSVQDSNGVPPVLPTVAPEPEVHDETEKLPIPSPGHANIIRNAPAKVKPLLRRAAAAGASVRQLEALKKRAQLPEFDMEKAVKNAQEKYKKEEKLEESKKRTVINSLKDVFPEQILQDITEHFDRVHFGTMTPAKLASIAFQLAQLTLHFTSEDLLIRYEEVKKTGQLKEFYDKIQEAL
jgi:ParB/RepB/Spo0J family partition protein